MRATRWSIAELVSPELHELESVASPARGAELIAKLDANESPISFDSEAVADLGHALSAVSLNRYGDNRSGTLRKMLAAAHGVAPDQLSIANGSNEIIRLLATVFGRPRRGRARPRVLYPSPTFFGYRAAALLARAEVVEVPLREDMSLDVAATSAALAATRPNLAFFCRPNNPTGTLWPREALEELSARHADTLIVVDEVYAAYAGSTLLDLLPRLPNLMILRSISKIGGAGLRVGYAIAHPEVISKLELIRPPFAVSALNEAAAVWLLTRGADKVAASIAAVIEERRRMLAELAEMPEISTFPSHANYFLFRYGRPGDRRATALWQRLLQRGIVTSSFDRPGPLAGCVRVTIGTRRENDLFLDTLRAVKEP